MGNIQFVLGGAPVTKGKQASIKDNLYMHVNYDWLQKAQIPVDKPAAGSFQDMDEAVHQKLMNDFDRYHQGKLSAPNPMFAEAMKMHQLALDFKQREQEGVTSLLEVIKPIQKLSLLTDLSHQLTDWVKNGFPLPLTIDVEPDWKNTAQNAVFMYAPELILPDKTYYTKPESDELLHTWANTRSRVLQALGYNQEQAADIVNQALVFDKLLVPHVLPADELADYPKQYNPRTLKEIQQYSQSFDFASTISELIDDHPEKVIVTQPQFFEHFDQIVNDTTFKNLKSWILTKTVNSLAKLLTDDLRQTADQFHQKLSGTQSQFLNGNLHIKSLMKHLNM